MKTFRLIAGVVVSIGVLLVLDLIPWKSDASQFSSAQLFLVLGATAAISVGVSSFAGAIVARVNFIGPAVLLALGAWYLAGTFVEAVSPSIGLAESTLILVANLSGLALTVGGAIIGASVGRRFCKQNEDNDSITA